MAEYIKISDKRNLQCIYNVDMARFPRDEVPIQPTFVYCPTQGLAPPELDEVDEIASLLEKLKRSYFANSSYNVGFQDRSAGIYLGDPRQLSRSSLEVVRRALSSCNKNWRILFLGRAPSETIFIYPDEIVYPEAWDQTDEGIDGAIALAIEDEMKLLDQTKGDVERQRNYVYSELRRLFPTREMPIRNPQIVCVFDTCEGNPEEISVWLLDNPSDSWLPNDLLEDGCLGYLEECWISQSGETCLVAECEGAWARLWLLAYNREKFHGEILLVDPSSKEVETFKAPSFVKH